MKLYTEEQVRRIAKLYSHEFYLLEAAINTEKPIELPSDEKIEEPALKWFMTANKHEIIFDLGWIKIFEAGAKWMKEQILNQNK